jgi:trehalose-phosphatase
MTPPWDDDLSHRLSQLGVAAHLFVCVDYDGTLAPIAPRPELARILPGARVVLDELACTPDTRVAVISGRALHDLGLHSNLKPPVILVGSHGAESSLHASRGITECQQALLARLHAALGETCLSTPGVWLERKPLSVAIHVRQAARSDAARVFTEVHRGPALWDGIHVTTGKEVLELSVSALNKGDALTQLRSDWDVEPRVLYIGDDLSDETAFAALRPADIGVKVGPGQSIASYRVPSEEAVVAILAFVCAERRSRQQTARRSENHLDDAARLP